MKTRTISYSLDLRVSPQDCLDTGYISILSRGQDPIWHRNNVLTIIFDGTQSLNIDPNALLFSSQLAQSVLDHVARYDKVLIHCTFGISRSGDIAEVLNVTYNHDDTEGYQLFLQD